MSKVPLYAWKDRQGDPAGYVPLSASCSVRLLSGEAPLLFRVSVFGFRFSGFGFRVSGFGFRVRSKGYGSPLYPDTGGGGNVTISKKKQRRVLERVPCGLSGAVLA